MKMRREFNAMLMRAQRTILVRRSSDFAQTITARYSAIEKRWPLMALIFEQHPQGDTTVIKNYMSSHPSYFISPRLLLRTLVKQELYHSDNVTTAAAESQPNNSVAVQKVFIAHAKPELITIPSEEFIVRIVSRSVRNEIMDEVKRIKSPSNSEPQHAFVARSKIHLPFVFKRSEPATQGSASASAANETQSIPKKHLNNSSSDVYTSAPSVDITRITDQVMQALDKRIVAQRERMGRI